MAPSAPEPALAGDTTLLEAVSVGAPDTARLWRMTNALIVPSRVSSLPGFTEASATSAANDWPVLVRATGGAPVPQFPGMLNIALAYRVGADQPWSIDDAYRHLAAVLTDALKPLGLDAVTGEIADAFCPGRYDLSLNGRKIAGLAQRRKRAEKGGQAILAHACLLVSGDLAGPFGALAAFEDAFMPTRKWRIEAATPLAAHLSSADPMAAAVAALIDTLRNHPSPL
ncbi:biotin/lipoate A/B protein ligase family protein [Dongia sp.]|uniref:lipoate--protein ligase family protein n=1 Tax=Dongia sp. TaxID=1977262 RepID=UPI0035B3CA35